MTQVFKNNAYASLAAELSASGTLATLATGQGARFPAPTGGDFFLATLILLDGNGAETAWEIVKCTARATDGLTIGRAQEGTTARIWPAGTRIELRTTAGTLDSFTDTTQAAAAAPVKSVAGKTGAVTLAKGDVGLGNVDNTSDANKPVSTAQQTALNGKENTGTAAAAVAAHAALTAAHGVGVVVGTTNTQTLTNKTISAANNTITTAASGNLTSTNLNAALAELQTDIDGRAIAGHDHNTAYAHIANGVTNGDSHDHSGGDGAQIAYASLSGCPALGTSAAKNIPATGNASATEVVYGTDTRLSNARTPTAHTHGNITNDGKIGATANLPIITTTSGVLTTGSFGTGATNFAAGNHNHSGVYQPADADIPTVAATQAEMDAGTESALRSMSPLRVAQAIAALGGGGTFVKADPTSVAFTKTGEGAAQIKAGTKVDVAGKLVKFAAATSITMPVLTAGTDYAIWVSDSATIQATTEFLVAPGAGNWRKIGGFHYAPCGNATARLGGDTTPQINEYSFWDLKYRPSAPDPRGMVVVAGSFCADIYLLGVDHLTNGTSKYNVTIADGTNPPKIPTKFGGNGSTAYGTLNWWEGAEVLRSHGKRYPTYDEFAALAYGATEAAFMGGDPVITAVIEEHTSKWGVIQASGCQSVWGAEFGGPYETAVWKDNTGGRGSTYNLPSAAIYGGSFADTSRAGTRASIWAYPPTLSSLYVGVRGICDLLIID